ncbi:hypothetical protein [Actinophytocola sp.]|uniref:hypothetical protein n=1 Tax=Actinophytocola sp. TaxID=1872138 RepID=UPI002D503648|nr:hypothetical protein [Actinophytocola sp.]HYQ65282.1 hypothetical protein [Actinophytocola sp.]
MTDAPVTTAARRSLAAPATASGTPADADARPDAEGPHDAPLSTFRARPASSRRRGRPGHRRDTDTPAVRTNTRTPALAGEGPA